MIRLLACDLQWYIDKLIQVRISQITNLPTLECMQLFQMQWTSTTPNPSPVYPQTQGLLSPQTYTGGATYSFTADFRPPTAPAEPPLITTNSPFKTVISKVTSFAPVSTTTGGTPVPSRNVCSNRRNGSSCQKMANGSTYHHNKMAAAAAAAAAMTTVNSDESQRPNLCRICGKTYARPSTLKTHLRTHSGEKPYRCVDCNKSFSQAANLTAHVRTHSGEKPFRCPICDRRFSQSSSVTTHMRTHSGERPYRCRLCKKAFSDSSTLTKHLRIHSGEKPYQCKLCLLRFSQSGNLNRHMRVHGGSGTTLPAWQCRQWQLLYRRVNSCWWAHSVDNVEQRGKFHGVETKPRSPKDRNQCEIRVRKSDTCETYPSVCLFLPTDKIFLALICSGTDDVTHFPSATRCP